MNVEINTKIKIFPQLYVGRKRQFEYNHLTKVRTQKVDLGFATPFENNAAFEKRKKTVDSWAIPSSDWDPVNRKPIPVEGLIPLIFDNVARTGFKITDDVRRVYWGGGNVVWRVEDPLGFELEISSQNLMAIIQTVGLQPGGHIPGKCVWARDGSNNVLLHESTEEFKTAYQVGKTKSTKGTKLSPELIGSKVSFSSGYVGFYLGSGSTFMWNPRGTQLAVREEFYHFFLDAVEAAKKTITLYRDPKPLLIEDGIKLTDAEALKLINDNRGEFRSAGSSYSSYGVQFALVNRAKKAKSFSYRLNPLASHEHALKKVQFEAMSGWCRVMPKGPDVLVGILKDKIYLLSSEQDIPRYNWYSSIPTSTTFSLNFEEITLDNKNLKPTGGYITLRAEDVAVGRNTPSDREFEAQRQATLLKLLQQFDSIAILVPTPIY